jgi:polyhydroxyalkanoate synthase subunit PhaC
VVAVPVDGADELAAPADLLLTSSAVGVAERIMPNVLEQVRAEMARHPRTVASTVVCRSGGIGGRRAHSIAPPSITRT